MSERLKIGKTLKPTILAVLIKFLEKAEQLKNCGGKKLIDNNFFNNFLAV